MKEEAKTKKELLRELGVLKKKNKLLEKANHILSENHAKEISSSEEKYHNIFEESYDGLSVSSPDGKILDINKRGLTMLGYETKEEIYKIDIAKDIYANPADRQRILSIVNSQGSAEYEINHKKKNGEIINVHTTLSAVKDSSGKIISYRAIIRDISKQKRAEKVLRESEERYHSIFENSITAVLLTTLEGKILAANPEACRIFGRTNEEICSLGREDIVDITDLRLAAILVERELTGTFKGELTFIKKDGTKFPGLLASKIFQDKDGNKQLTVVIYDITDLKRAEEAIHKAADEIHDLYNHAPCGYHSLDEDCMYVRINDTELEWLGYRREEVIGKMKFSNLLVPSSLNIFEENFSRLKISGISRELELDLIRKDSSIISVLLNETAITNNDGIYLMSRSTMHDITKRKEAEEISKIRRDELERFERLTINRELKMIELKKRITELEA
jgi:PAS domain S-box-containing protein